MDTATMENPTAVTTKSPVVWWEMAFNDLARARKFYEEMFGWEFTAVEGLPSAYWMADTGQGMFGGGFYPRDGAKAGEGATPQCIISMGVDNIHYGVSRAIELGATLVHSPMPIPGGVHYAQITDPDGNTIGLVGPEVGN